MDANEKKELTELIEFLKANGIVKFETERDGRKVALEFAGAAGFDTAHLATLLAFVDKNAKPTTDAAETSISRAAAPIWSLRPSSRSNSRP